MANKQDPKRKEGSAARSAVQALSGVLKGVIANDINWKETKAEYLQKKHIVKNNDLS